MNTKLRLNQSAIVVKLVFRQRLQCPEMTIICFLPFLTSWECRSQESLDTRPQRGSCDESSKLSRGIFSSQV